ncbi:MAG: hypothetical protein WDZ68_02155, partial [Candidatus Paceibacterota bacterium]
NNGVGSVQDDGSRTVYVDSPTTFTLTALGTGGNDSCVVKVEVEEKHEKPTPRCEYLNVSDSRVEKGDRVTLSWDTTNADDVYINQGIGHVGKSGSKSVYIDHNTTFTLTAEKGYKEDTCTVYVDVEKEKEVAPRCDLDISDHKVKKGDEVTLDWDVRDAEEITIEDDRGEVIYRDRNPSSRERGDIDVEITRDTEFTLIAEGKHRDVKCRVEVEVDDEILVLTERDQKPIVAGISLTQVPYTGFEAGPMLTFLFYALLTVWAFVVAYMLVIRKETVLGFSLGGVTAHNQNPIQEEHFVETTPEQTESYVHSTSAPTAEAPANVPTHTPVIGYSAYTTDNSIEEQEEAGEENDELTVLENHAHANRVLFSSDALRFFYTHNKNGDVISTFDALIGEAKETFPSEGGWIVLNLARVEQLTGTENETENEIKNTETVTQTSVATSLAEAIVKGNISAAYRMIEHRPMVALADATTELDTVYRMKQSGIVAEEESSSLYTELSKHSPEQLKEAIDALTGALDGTYNDEESAVKIAIMKAVKVFA